MKKIIPGLLILFCILCMNTRIYADCIEVPPSGGEEQHGQQVDPWSDLSNLSYTDFSSSVTVFNGASNNLSELAVQIWNYLNDGNESNNYQWEVQVRGELIWITNTDSQESWSVSAAAGMAALNYYDSQRSYFNGNNTPAVQQPPPCDGGPIEEPYAPWIEATNPFNRGGDLGGGWQPPATTVPINGGICPTDVNVTLTTQLIAWLYPTVNRGVADQVVSLVNQYKDQFGLTGRRALAYFLSQVLAETSAFTVLEENWNYKTTKQVLKIFQKRILPQDPANFLSCECLFNKVYAGVGENGDSASGDGFKYRGRGIIQLTHKASYRLFGEYLPAHGLGANPDFVANPGLIKSNLKYAVLSALWEFTVDKNRSATHKPSTNMPEAIAADDIYMVSKLINGKNPAEKIFERMAVYHYVKQAFCL